MDEPINFKRLYELSIIEKEQIITDNQKHLEIGFYYYLKMMI